MSTETTIERLAIINGKSTPAPAGAVAWKYGDPTDGRWLYDAAEAREVEGVDPSLVAWVGHPRALLGYELARVFDAAVRDDFHRGFIVDGWPDRIQYDPERALPVLRSFASGHGSTEEGDAEVCAALERAGAVVRS